MTNLGTVPTTPPESGGELGLVTGVDSTSGLQGVIAVKTKTYHISNFGSMTPAGVDCVDGYVTIHDSTRYSDATVQQLHTWTTSRLPAVRDAALTELANREVQNWRNSN